MTVLKEESVPMRKLLLSLVLIFSGCGSLHEEYVKQDRNNYETLWPRIEKMLESTTEYDDDQKADIQDRGNAWDAWTTQGMKAFE